MRVLNDTPEEKKKIIDMWSYCFSDPKEFVDWNFSHNFKPQQTFVAERNGEICANLQLIPYKAMLLGQETDCAYVSGVATMPQYRNKGCVREIIEESLIMLNQNGIPISCLIPFNFGFYEKFGFKVISDKLTLNLPLEKIPYSEGAEFVMLNISDGAIERLNTIYSEMCKKLNFYIIRKPENWNKILEDIILNSGGFCVASENAYILYGFDGENRENINVYELGYSSANGFRAALSFLKAHSSQSKNVKIVMLNSPLIGNELCDIKDLRQINPLAMLRITDVPYVLKLISNKCKLSFKIEIKDDIIRANNLCFKIHDGTVTMCDYVDYIDGKAVAKLPDLRMDISTFSSVVCGYLGIKDGIDIGYIKLNDEAESPRMQSVINQLSDIFNANSDTSFINLML